MSLRPITADTLARNAFWITILGVVAFITLSVFMMSTPDINPNEERVPSVTVAPIATPAATLARAD